jgi:hypothetical protein
MALINVSLKHGVTVDEARGHLAKAVDDSRALFGAMVRSTEWSADRSRVRLDGSGFWVEMWVDPTEVHATGDIPALGGLLLGGPLATGLKAVLQKSFPKQLT